MLPYSDVRSRITPIPTPGLVRLSSSLLGAAAVALPSTDLGYGIQFLGVLLCSALAIAFPFLHPYRGRVRAYRAEKDAPWRPQLWQFLPLFFLWLALMLAPVIAPAPWWGSALLFAASAGWLYLTFPHVDGTRALAYIDAPPTDARR
ncbi:hypothetical protein [Corynebacterium lowii]|uniref:Uncharacterized protein n=1 Tax=Corynebacterium lowii TaxID=1544413 RepID=A0A0Q0UGG6_9CORY|nr:hypothetical protein [Corynebacterium lowii]KQB87470.1 hypothetical protein Clow_00529 [Corynebacterium lowii]MDP9851936.1 hypothetical protein [Corynebacterium lowii]